MIQHLSIYEHGMSVYSSCLFVLFILLLFVELFIKCSLITFYNMPVWYIFSQVQLLIPSLFFFFLFWCTHIIWKFPGQGLNLSHSCDLHRSCGNAIHLIHCLGQGSNPCCHRNARSFRHCATAGISFIVFFLIEVQLIYNVVLVSSVQQSDSYIYMYTYIFTHTHIYSFSDFFFFWLHLWHAEVLRPRIKPTLQLQSVLKLWQQCQILNPPCHRELPQIFFHWRFLQDLECSFLSFLVVFNTLVNEIFVNFGAALKNIYFEIILD